MADEDQKGGAHEKTVPLGPPRPSSSGSGSQSAPLLGGRYRLIRQLGAGGMGTVHEAEHLDLNARVAVKLLGGVIAPRDDAAKRFAREARAAASVRHDHVALVTDFGADETRGPFLVMELLEGETLGSLLERASALPIDLALRIGGQIADGLSAVHGAGIVHRDLKPPNVFLVPLPEGRMRVKILDFGIARVERDEELITQGVVVGTPTYMAPELFDESPRTDVRSDLYALGVLLYRMISGHHPYRGSGAELLVSILKGEAEPLEQVMPTTPPEVSALVSELLERDASLRPTSAASVRERLFELGGGREIYRDELEAAAGIAPIGESRRSSIRPSGDSRPSGRSASISSTAPSVRPPLRTSDSIPVGPRRLLTIAAAAIVTAGAIAGIAIALGAGPELNRPLGPQSALDTNPVRYGVSRYVDAATVREQHAPLIDHLSRRLGRSVQLVVHEDYLDVSSALRRGDLQLAALSPLVFVRTLDEDPRIEVVARAVSAGGDTYTGYIVSRRDDNIRTLTDLKGHVFCYVSPTSTSGYLYPRALMRGAGMDPDADFRATRFTGDHVSALRALAAGACDGAAVFASMLHDARANDLEPESFRILASTDPIPYDAYVVGSTVDSVLREEIARALLELVPGSAGAAALAQAGSDLRGFVAADTHDWDGVRNVLRSAPEHEGEAEAGSE